MISRFFSFPILGIALCAGAQGWTYSPEFGTDFWSNQPQQDVQFVNCNTGSRSVQSTAICMRQDGANGFDNPIFITSKMTNTTGLSGKVARGVAAARPRTGTTSTRTSTTSRPTSAKQAQRMGKNYNYQTSDAHRAWLADKRERQLQAQKEAAEKKRREQLARRIADDNRAAAVTAQTNAMLQHQTDRRIARDHYHATEGARQAQERARQAHRLVGPQFAQSAPKSSGKDKARMLRGQNKPRRVMYPQTQKRNTARATLPQVERQPLPQERAALLKKALMVRAELRRQKKAEKAYAEYQGIKLDNNAVSTLGKDWNSIGTGPLAPPPTTRTTLTHEEMHKMMIDEFLSPNYMTPEEYRRMYLDEMLGES